MIEPGALVVRHRVGTPPPTAEQPTCAELRDFQRQHGLAQQPPSREEDAMQEKAEYEATLAAAWKLVQALALDAAGIVEADLDDQDDQGAGRNERTRS